VYVYVFLSHLRTSKAKGTSSDANTLMSLGNRDERAAANAAPGIDESVGNSQLVWV
jgi:hypothetical protein